MLIPDYCHEVVVRMAGAVMVVIICIVVFLGVLIAAGVEVARTYDDNFKD